MNRAGQMLGGLLAAALVMGGIYGVYVLAGGPEQRVVQETRLTRQLNEQEARNTFQSWWDGDGHNAWTHEAVLDSFGVKSAEAGSVDSLVMKGRLADTVRVVTVPVGQTRWQQHQ